MSVDDLLDRLGEIQRTPLPPRHPKKEFKPDNPEVVVLDDYSKAPGKDFWKKFPKNKNIRGGTPYKIKVDKIEELIVEAGEPEQLVTLFEEVKSDIVNGADLKVEPGYKPTVSKNAASAFKDGKYVTDAVASGLKNKIFAGPFKKEEVPAGVTVNSLQTAPKPNGKVRIILNQSSPEGASVNDFIDKRHYPSDMGGIKEIVWALNACGRGALFAKCDWNAAYKHVSVTRSQLCYQWFMWLTMFFVELCLIFGCTSSVGLY